MGIIYRAHHVRLRRDVALKLIAPELADDPEFRARFERESELAAGLEHPHVIPIYDAGEADGVLLIAMRLIRGTDVRELLVTQRRLAPERAALLAAQVGDALDAAHRAGLVHRDVKPANILVAQDEGDEHAYLTDFGLMKHAGARSGELTRTGAFVGTVDYAAPEQLDGRRVDARTDVYALGCTLFHCRTGEVPFPRDSDLAKMWAHTSDPAPGVRAVAPELPDQFDAIVARALRKEPAERFQSAGDLGRAAVAAARGSLAAEPERSVAAGAAAPVDAGNQTTRKGTAPAATLPPTVVASSTPATPDPPTRILRGGRRRSLVAVGVAAVLVGLGAVVALVAGGGGSDPGDAGSADLPADTRSCGGELSANPNASCPFARNVRAAFERSGGDGTVRARSPAKGRVYEMSCTADSPHVCRGGNDAAVYFP